MRQIPGPSDMHSISISLNKENPGYEADFSSYVVSAMQKFSGLSAVPRIICGEVTREYMTFSMRDGHKEDYDELLEVANQCKCLGYFVELDDSPSAYASGTVSFLICWDPEVLRNSFAQQKLVPSEYFQFYLTVMQYIRAEKSIANMSLASKEVLKIGNKSTTCWTSIPLVSNEMRNTAILVARVLWDLGYYAGIRSNPRRENTWTFFVSWDKSISFSAIGHDEYFSFAGCVPPSWS